MTSGERLDAILRQLKNVHEEKQGQWTAQCPAHEDRRNSLSVNVSGEGSIGLHCHAGCATAAVAYALGFTLKELFPERQDGAGKGAAKGGAPKGKIVKAYDYLDADGVLLYQVCRMEPKDFRQRRPDGKGGWSWKVKDVPKVLYRLPEVLRAGEKDPGEPVLIVEGEKDADNLAAEGFVATCNAGGAGKWLAKYTRDLRGRHVVIVPDFDPPNAETGKRPGSEHALLVARHLRGEAESVRILELPGLAEGQDVSDWLAVGGENNAAAIRRLVKECPEWHPAGGLSRMQSVAAKSAEERLAAARASSAEEQIVAALRLDVLGELEDGRIKLFSEEMRKAVVLRDVNRMSYADLLRIAGPPAKGLIYTGQDDPPPGFHKVGAVREAIAYIAGRRRLGEDSESGVGVWPGKSDDGDETDALIFVGAGEAAVLNGKPELLHVTRPRYGGRLLNLSGSDPWFDFTELQRSVGSALNPEWRRQAVEQSDALWSQWKWKHPDASPALMTGLILATWIQTVWRWRPQVCVTGKSSSGKSTLFGALGGGDHRTGIFGRLAVKSSGSTAAGLRQAVATTAAVLLCDEFDSNKHRREVLEMLRSAGGGDTVLRGTTGHKQKQFRLQHIAWTAGIESGLDREPDRNRFVLLELEKPRDEEMGRLVLPDDDELAHLGLRLLASAARTVREARRLVEEFRQSRPAGIHARVVESYAVPAAAYAAATGLQGSEAVVLFLRLIDTYEEQDDEGDEAALLNEILESQIDVGRGARESVSQLLARFRYLNPDQETSLERSGVTYRSEEGRGRGNHDADCLFVVQRAVKRHLLRGSDWERAKIDEVLLRIGGARRARKTIGGKQAWGVMIPRRSVEHILPQGDGGASDQEWTEAAAV